MVGVSEKILETLEEHGGVIESDNVMQDLQDLTDLEYKQVSNATTRLVSLGRVEREVSSEGGFRRTVRLSLADSNGNGNGNGHGPAVPIRVPDLELGEPLQVVGLMLTHDDRTAITLRRDDGELLTLQG